MFLLLLFYYYSFRFGLCGNIFVCKKIHIKLILHMLFSYIREIIYLFQVVIESTTLCADKFFTTQNPK